VQKLTEIGRVDVRCLGHVQPRSVPEGLLEEREQGAAEDGVGHFIGGCPLLRAEEVAANVDEGLDLLVPLLGVLEVGSDVEGLALLAGVADSLALPPLRVLLGLLLLLNGVLCLDLLPSVGERLRGLRLFEDPGLLATDRCQPLEDPWEEAAGQGLLSKL
jgi:hypothetical protein